MKAFLAALAGAALLGASAAPAAAAPSAFGTLSCFSGASLGATGTARGEKDTSAIVAETEIPGGQTPSTARFAQTVPVWFHVVARDRSRSGGWVSDARIHEQLDVLNAAFASSGTGFRFALKEITRTVNERWHELETFQDEVDMKSALKRGDATTLNIYSVDAGVLGFAYYPKIVAGNPYQVLDGIVIHPESMPGGRIKNFDLGHTATHEAGHWLGLPHTFEQGCIGHGDHVDDTPAMSVPTSGCPIGKDTCPEPGTDPIHNYMDYSWDSCYTEFTPGQAERMQQQFLHWRVKHGYAQQKA